MCTIKYSTSNGSYLVGCYLNSFLTEMGEIIPATTEHGGQTSDSILIDGTFKNCPTFFRQLYTVHGTVNGHYMLLVYCLLSNKTQDIYTAICGQF